MMRAIPSQRLTAQHASPTLLWAMQAQEYEQAKWAVGLRTSDTTAADIERLLADGQILRSHPMRGTHQFVARDELRWLMALMGSLMIGHHLTRRALAAKQVRLTISRWGSMTSVVRGAITDAAHRYGEFVDRPVELTFP